jgi:glycosyltransferase involved in cell wall biosynthesis
MKTKLYIDLSMIMQINYMTGIQRVVQKAVIRLLKNENLDITLLCYNSENESFKIVDNDRLYDLFANHIGTKGQCYTQKSLDFSKLESGSVYLDMDNTWNSRLVRSYIYPILKKSGVQIVNFVHDILPITDPQYSHETTVMHFIGYIGAVIEYSDKVCFSAQADADAFEELCEKLGKKCPSYSIIALGADINKNKEELPPKEELYDKNGKVLPEYKHLIVSAEVKKAVEAGKFILMVGTVEPRKNHKVVIDALDKGLDINVIIVGKMGWNVADLKQRILSHPLYNKKLFLLNNVNDAGIDYLYENAYLLAFPTFNEGYGLPMVEAFQKGLPVIASDIPVLKEIGQDYADYFDNTNPSELVDYVKKSLENPEKYQIKKDNLKNYKSHTWDEFAEKLGNAIVSSSKCKGTVENTDIKQMVVLTARHEDIMKSLPFIEAFMPFIKELVVCCPEWNVEPFKENYKGRLKLTFRTDDELLKGRPLPEDHQARNFFLRCMMMDLDVLDDVFIMTDDDYRPMQPISQEVFLKDGRYQSYYFYDLKEWQGTYNNYSSFDLGAFKTRDFLESCGYPTYQYSSHQPQVIDKNIFKEMLETHKGIENNPYDEWSTYFNFGLYHHPDKFTPCPNISMCWPGKLTSWNLYHNPGIFMFENYYEDMYAQGNIFEGFSQTYYVGIEKENQQKAHIFRKAIEQQFYERKVFDSYSRFYFDQEGEYPAMVVHLDKKSGKLAVHTPTYIQFQTDCWTRVPVVIDPVVYEKYKGYSLYISYHFKNTRGITVLNSQKIEIQTGDEKLMLPVRSPKTRIKQGSMLFQAYICEKQENGDVEEEKTITLKDLERKGQWISLILT